MSAALRTGYEALSSDQARRVDAVCDRFETAWRMGQRPTIEDYLGEMAAPERSVVERGLLPVEVDPPALGGEAPQREDYQERFPELGPAWLAGAVLPPPRPRPVSAPPPPPEGRWHGRGPRARLRDPG